MFSHLLNRHPRRSLLIEFNPYQILVAGITRPHRGAVVLDCAAEFDRQDAAGLRRWIDDHFDKRKTWMPAICGVVPRRSILQRHTLQPRRLAEPDYLANLVKEQQGRRTLSATPFAIGNPGVWSLRTVSAVDGALLRGDGDARPALICGIPNAEVHETQQRLLDHRLMPVRLEPSLLALLGAVYGSMEHRRDSRAVVIVVIYDASTSLYILGKEGVHTPGSLPYGFSSIVQLARKEFNLADDAAALRRLREPNPDLLNRAGKLVRMIGRDLKWVVDSYELTTGQPVGEIHCAYLPANLAWIAEPLARIAERATFTMDSQEWLASAGLQTDNGVPPFEPRWLGALSLAANLPETTALKPGRIKGAHSSFQRSWHVDCRLSAELPGTRLVRRRFLAGALAAALAAFAVIVTAWQLLVRHSLRTDTAYWARQMAENQKLFDALTTASSNLSEASARLDHAYDLMAAPYPVTELILNLGRTLPPRMRIDRIEANDHRVTLGGGWLEPSEEASRSLGAYLSELRRTPEVGRLFSSIAITSLQRDDKSETMTFEITLRLKAIQR